MKFNITDVEIQWFSGTGKGGQHRNKHQNCCRAIHKPTGLQAVGQRDRSREANQTAALAILEARVADHFHQDTERYRATTERVRTYHQPDNRVIDHASGFIQTYREVVENGRIDDMIEARRKSQSS